MPELSLEDFSLGKGLPLDQLEVNQQALVALVAALVAGVALALLGIVLGLNRHDVIVFLVLLAVLVGLVTAYILFRAMFAAADNADGTAMGAVTHPAFFALFGGIVLLISLAIGFFYGRFFF